MVKGKKKALTHIEEYLHKFMGLSKLHQMSFLFVVFLGTVMVWRGIYNLMNSYWFPARPLISNISGIIIGLMIVASTHYAVRKVRV